MMWLLLVISVNGAPWHYNYTTEDSCRKAAAAITETVNGRVATAVCVPRPTAGH